MSSLQRPQTYDRDKPSERHKLSYNSHSYAHGTPLLRRTTATFATRRVIMPRLVRVSVNTDEFEDVAGEILGRNAKS